MKTAFWSGHIKVAEMIKKLRRRFGTGSPQGALADHPSQDMQTQADYNVFIVGRRLKLPVIPAPTPLDTERQHIEAAS
ncbi:hypothetical protein PEBR_40117 [Penicillium brasilianum]|uniref:Uncharacterized protein n=1 Tax=Penicillium brasilianum TaxID=104259 RepID=A0A1S9RAJ6_PENBI|nr:hypothetical protein PEBR_40117 [Penicillium brasilianum]